MAEAATKLSVKTEKTEPEPRNTVEQSFNDPC
jgi:hypothetical protein